MDLRDLSDDGLTIVFAGDPHDLDVYTLSEALVGLADALREINQVVDPEFFLDIAVEANEPGSFITKLRLRKFAKSPLVTIPGGILIGMLTNYLYDLAAYTKPVYRLDGDEFVIETSTEVIKLPAKIIEHQQKVAQTPSIAKGVKKAFQAIEEDGHVDAVALYPSGAPPEEARALITIPRDDFDTVIANANMAIEGTRLPFELERRRTVTQTITERTALVIVKAVLRRSRRKWQFNWKGDDISARISDPTFFTRLERRQIVIAQGDALDVELAITQILGEDNVWQNQAYEVVRVYDLIELPRQSSFDI